MRTDSIKKYVLPNIPYLFVLWACLKLGTAYRLAAGADFAHTAKPRRICGRPLRSRQPLVICSAIRTGGKIRPRSVSPGRIQQALAPGLWDNLSRSPAGLGSSPTSIFAGLRPAKISECGHTRIACRLCAPLKIKQSTIDRFGYLCYTVQ